MRATRAASIPARSGWDAMLRLQLVASQPSHGVAVCARPQRPPNVIGATPPSSSGSATIIVASTGSSPRGSACHWSRVWNSTGCAVT